MGAALQFTHTLETETCCNCGTPFAMTTQFQAARRRDGDWFYCPAGHAQHYAETEASKLRKELDRERRLREMERNQRESTERQLASAQREASRLRKRAAAGVCPCCHRTFTALARHMKSKHPDFPA